MSTIRTTDTRTVHANIGDDQKHITVADLLDFADHLRAINAPTDADVYQLKPVILHGYVKAPVALYVAFPRDADAPKVTPPAPPSPPPAPNLHHVVELTISTRTQGYPTVYVRAHGPGGIWHVETAGRLYRTLHLETNDLTEALDHARELADTR